MRISALAIMGVLLTVNLLVAAPGHGQGNAGKQISLRLKDVTLASAIKAIQKKADVAIMYELTDKIKNEKITLTVKGKTVPDILNELIEDKNLTWNYKNDVYRIIEASDTTATPSGALKYPALFPPPITIRGKIINEKGEPAIVSVIIKETKRGTVTDNNGVFTLKDVNENAVLIISGTNIETQEISVDNRTDFDITVQTKITEEETVTVSTGYFSTSKERSTGNIVKVDAKDIEKQPVTTPLMSLQGRVAGLDIVPANGVPGSAVKIQIRGNNSLRVNGSNPLFVVDGVPFNPDPLSSTGRSVNFFDPLSTINPANIESIEVLKDAAATAIYGSRGANGVILIRTKQNKKSGKTDFETSFYSGFGELTNRLDMMNTKQYLAMRYEGLQNAGMSPGINDYDIIDYDSSKDVNWQDELLGGTASIMDLQMSLSGGNARTSFRFGGSYHKEKTIYPGDFGFHSVTGNLNINHHSLDEKFHFNTTINYGKTLNNLVSDGDYVRRSILLPPNAPALYDENGELNWAYKDYFGSPQPTFMNPLARLRNTHESRTDNLTINSVISYNLMPGLSVRLNTGFTNTNQSEIAKYPMAANPSLYASFYRGEATFGDNKRQSWVIEPQVLYRKNIGAHNIDFIIGSTVQSSENMFRAIRGTGYTSDVLLNSIKGAASQFFDADDEAEYKYISAYARIGYDWQQKYLIDLVGRRDGSSRFSPGKKFGNFGAIGAGWIFTKESLFDNNLHFLSFGKVRGSYGVTGNDQIGDYQYYNLYQLDDIRFQGNVSFFPRALFNPDFQWESTTKTEVSLELGFFKDRLSTQVNWYKNRSSNQLVNYTAPATTGFNSIFRNFDATIENTGWEIVANTKNISTKLFSWNTNFNISVPRNRLVKFDNIESSPYKDQYKVGEPLDVVRGFVWTGVDPETGIHTFLDINKDGQVDADNDFQFNSERRTKYFGGINNSFQYKNFDLSFLFQFVGQKTLKLISPSVPGSLNANQLPVMLARWRKPGDITDVQQFWNTFGGDAGAAYNYYLPTSSYDIQDGSFIRLKTLSLSYRFSDKLLKKTTLDAAQIYFQAQNLLTITDYVGLDPQTFNSALPPLRMLTFGIQVKF